MGQITNGMLAVFFNWQTINVHKYSPPKGEHTAATQQFGLFLINNQTVVENFLSITYCAAGDHRQF